MFSQGKFHGYTELNDRGVNFFYENIRHISGRTQNQFRRCQKWH